MRRVNSSPALRRRVGSDDKLAASEYVRGGRENDKGKLASISDVPIFLLFKFVAKNTGV